jgi:hypothetical protein
MTSEVVSRVEITKAGFTLANNLWDTITDLCDSVPVVGNIIDELADTIQALATAGDWDDAIGLISDPDYLADIQCHLYCALKEHAMTELSRATVAASINDMLLWSLTLLPGGPFLTLYGQIFAAYAKSIPDGLTYRRAYIKRNDTNNDCEEICEDCLEEPDTWEHVQDLTLTDGGWEVINTSENYGVWVSGTGWTGNAASAAPEATYIKLEKSLGTLTYYKVEFSINGAPHQSYQGAAIGVYSGGVLVEGHRDDTQAEGSGGSLEISGTYEGADKIDMYLNTSAGYMVTAYRVTLRGIGTEPSW